jgi:hypothetical protein
VPTKSIGLRPLPSTIPVLAPLSIRNFTISTFPDCAAMWRAVIPSFEDGAREIRIE